MSFLQERVDCRLRRCAARDGYPNFVQNVVFIDFPKWISRFLFCSYRVQWRVNYIIIVVGIISIVIIRSNGAKF